MSDAVNPAKCDFEQMRVELAVLADSCSYDGKLLGNPFKDLDS